MFIREVVKQNEGYKQKFIYHTLVESYRTEKGPRQRTLLSLGKLSLPRDKCSMVGKHYTKNRVDTIVNDV